MIAVPLFWLALLAPGYAAVRLVCKDDIKSGLLGTVALSYMAVFALLSPVSILCYLLELPLAVLSGACLLACFGGLFLITMRRWWRDIGGLMLAAASVELLILIIDAVMGARAGGYLAGGDVRLHLARVRFLIDHGISNLDPYTAEACFLPIYHTNILHALYAACSQLTGVDYLGVWYATLPWAKVVTAGGIYYLAWRVFDRQWVAWALALFTAAWLAPATYLLYPNKLAPHWLIPMMLGFTVEACGRCDRRTALKLAVGSLLLGQVHALYAIFVGIAVGPALAMTWVARWIRRRADRWRVAACLAALFVGAPFVLIAHFGRERAERAQPPPIEQTQKFNHLDNGWAILNPPWLRGGQGKVHVALLALGTAAALACRRREQTGMLVGITGTLIAILFIPPVCSAAIRVLGKEWIVARLGSILLTALLVLALGGICYWIADWVRRKWLRALISIAIVFAGAQFVEGKEPHDWSTYLRIVKAPAEERHHLMNGMRTFSEFCRQSIPAGETVLADGPTQTWLVMLHDCYVVAVGLGGGVTNLAERQADLQAMLERETPWPVRRSLLRKYDIQYFMVYGDEYHESGAFRWTDGHLYPQRWALGKHLVVRLKTD